MSVQYSLKRNLTFLLMITFLFLRLTDENRSCIDCTSARVRETYIRIHIHSSFGHTRLQAQPVTLSAAGEVELCQFWKLSPMGRGGTLLNFEMSAKINVLLLSLFIYYDA